MPGRDGSVPPLVEHLALAVVVVELGGNDGLRGLSLAATRANFETMIKAGQAAGAKILLCGMQLPPNYGRDYTERFRAMYTDLARAHGVALLPFFLEGVGDRRELFQADGIHPTAAGHRLIAGAMVAFVPEPGTIVLLALGLFGIVATRKRQTI